MALSVHARSQLPDGVLAFGSEPVRLTWQVSGADPGDVQRAYEVEVADGPDFGRILATSGVVESADQVGIEAPGGSLRSREARYLRVRVLTDAGWSAWSPTLRLEAGLLEASDWVAQAITLPDDPGRDRQSPSPHPAA